MRHNDLSNWQACSVPGKNGLDGAYCRLEPLNWSAHGTALFAAICGPGDAGLWDYLPFGPLHSQEDLMATLDHTHRKLDWRTMVIFDTSVNTVQGMASYMRLRPEHGSAEVGCIVFSKKLQRTRAATEAIYLMARHLFDDLGYRRFEWKCNDKNAASKSAALRFGFTYEGVFRNDMIVKGRNRDTAWFSMIDREWPAIRTGFQTWLDPDNFDADGKQRSKLSAHMLR